MWSSALLLFLYFIYTTSAQHLWNEQRDDLNEYQLDTAAPNVRSKSECAMLAEPKHQAVEFNQADGTCRMYICQLGWSGCRKCRNARNSSMPLLLVRHLDQVSHTCWRTFQHRVDGSVDFYRNWTDYLTSFGQGEDRNYWMGLEAIHQLTRAGDRRARWEMSMWNGTWFWWEDLFIAVQGADQGFRVTVGDQDITRSNVVSVSHSAGAHMNNKMFSTPDWDRDISSTQCTERFQGSWWYGNCHTFNPNGKYFSPPTAFNLTSVVSWAVGLTFQGAASQYPLNSDYSMQTFECMVSDTV